MVVCCQAKHTVPEPNVPRRQLIFTSATAAMAYFKDRVLLGGHDSKVCHTTSVAFGRAVLWEEHVTRSPHRCVSEVSRIARSSFVKTQLRSGAHPKSLTLMRMGLTYPQGSSDGSEVSAPGSDPYSLMTMAVIPAAAQRAR